MLEILPPAVYTSKGFLVGEAWTHHPNGAAAYSAFFDYRGQHYECNEPMTSAEFRAFDPATITVGILDGPNAGSWKSWRIVES